jgi:RNA polymerase sigma-70 factor (ECF subfamily)
MEFPLPGVLNQSFPATEKEVVRKAAEETENCFLLYSRGLRRYVLTLLPDPGDAAEVVQEAFYRLFAHLRQGRRVDNYRAWLSATCQNLAMDEWRRRSRMAPLECGESGGVDFQPDIETRILDRERIERLQATIQVLPELARRCVELRMKGLRLREIAEQLGVSVSTVSAELVRSASRLRRIESASR